ncbi:MAG: fructose-bisphosphatase class II [candidate division Zixibacteria bacterium]|nr:fructose-bisphosphatase class II [candidate division Zixibacteria bacterium]
MENRLRYDIADQRIQYTGLKEDHQFSTDRIIEFNHRHRTVLTNYGISLSKGQVSVLSNRINDQSNLGSLRNRQLRESVILAAALSAVAVGLHGRGELNRYPEHEVTKSLANNLKRANDRTAAQIMSEVLQTTTDVLPPGEEVLIATSITEGVRAKPGYEAGGNPTIAVGAVFGKEEHRSQYGLPMHPGVTLLSMGNDVIDGTTKSVKDLHSSFTSLFLTESNIKRHLPDIYVQRWMSGAFFEEFNPRETNLLEVAEIIANSYGSSDVTDISSFFLDRKRHYPAMDELNRAGITTPFDTDGDLFPAIILGLDGLRFPEGQRLNSMLGEIGGSAEWAVGVLPLVWRGGQAIGMLTSQSALTRRELSSERLWSERFNFTEDEFMMIQDARFEHKPCFSIRDILEDPFAGGISAFGAITDNSYLPFMDGVISDPDNDTISVNVLAVNSMGVMECWQLVFKCNQGLTRTVELMSSPKDNLVDLEGKKLENAIGDLLDDEKSHRRFRICFGNEYYSTLIPVRDKVVLLHRALEGMIKRGALDEHDRQIIEITSRLANHWFVSHNY